MAPMSLELGQLIDAKYRVVRRIGEGGMGTVYEGENKRIGRRVAIKVLHAQVASMPEFVERFEREARAAARIGSPHVCDVLDLGDLPNGDRYIVMEYLDGISFEDRIVERGKLTTSQLAPIAFELLEGLGTMHGARVIHRDLKPANVFLAKANGGRGEVVKILDFGVAKLLPFGTEVGTMTQTGTMMGTPLYMSPEQARGARDVDGRTDIYAASVMFYRALTGKLPYNADTLNELLFKIVLEDPRPLRELAPEVDEGFAAIIHKGLARDLEQRFPSARAYQEAIASWGRQQGRSSLSFAVTLPSDPPPPLTPITLPEPPGSPRPVASAVTATSGGTPIAWSEDAPGESAKGRSAPTVMTPADESAAGSAANGERNEAQASKSAAGSSAPPSSSASSASSTSGSTLASASSDPNLALAATGPATAASSSPPAVAASTGPTPIAEVSRSTNPGAARSKRGLIAGLVGAGALAVVAIAAFGRGNGPAPTGVTQAPPGLGSAQPQDPSQTPLATAAKEATSAPTAAANGQAHDAGSIETSSASASATSPSSTATAAPRHETAAGPSTARRNEGAPKPAIPAVTSATAPTVTTAAAPAASTAPAKPAGSARKFRTNID